MVYTQTNGAMSSKRGLFAGIAAVVATAALSLGISTSIFAAHNPTGCSFGTVPGVWSLEGNCTTTAPLDVPANTLVEGNGFTITAGFNFVSNGSGISKVLGITDADNVTVNNLTIDSGTAVGLTGINVFQSAGVTLNNVKSINNDKYGLTVNGSNVVVDDISTAGNGWGGVNVGQGSGVIEPAVLTVNGMSSHTDMAHIYIDDTQQNVTVNDTNSQYKVTEPVTSPDRPFDRLYTLKPSVASSKDECKDGGWMNFQAAYKNQGQCVSSVVSKRQ